ncbi:MAG: fluoride efflux transporter CrcB [Chthonomonadales bacterium]|nr:fluoride efflux transporter CrcB [Chthonomonadales bacterium]
MWSKCLVVGLGGFLGANARYLIGEWVYRRLGADGHYSTFAINVTGSFVLALFATVTLRPAWNESWRLLVAIGFLGAYTTFSTFAYETLLLLAQGRLLAAAGNVAGNVLLGLAAGYLGVVAARPLTGLPWWTH